MLLNLLNGHRETRPGNRTIAYEQAHQLYKAGQKELGTDEEKFVIQIYIWNREKHKCFLGG